MANIKDVAKLANVSVATVSRVINNKGYINEHTKALVLEAINELNYVPNELARSLYRKSSKIIGILIPDLKNEFFNEMISEMEEVILHNGYKTMLCATKEDPEREKKYLEMFSTNKVAGIIVCTNILNEENYKKVNIPLVTLEREFQPDNPVISSDNTLGGEIAAKELVKRGCKHIAQFRGPSALKVANQRSEGFLKVLGAYSNIKTYNLEVEFIGDPTEEITKYLIENPHIDGIFAASDYIAAKALNSLKGLGKRVPEDVQVIGYDNISICEVTSPMLSTIAQPIQEMGEVATQTLFKLINNEEITECYKKLPVKFIERQSTRNV